MVTVGDNALWPKHWGIWVIAVESLNFRPQNHEVITVNPQRIFYGLKHENIFRATCYVTDGTAHFDASVMATNERRNQIKPVNIF
jgi:hypothetical protein